MGGISTIFGATFGFKDALQQIIGEFPNLSSAISGMTTAAGKATGVFGKLKAAGTSALTSLSKLGGGLGTLIIPTAAIVGIYALLKYIREAADRAEEKFSATSQESSELESELNSLNSELETTNAKIKELEQKGTLSFTDVEELKNLKLQNAELERSIILATQRQKVLNQQKHTDFQDMMDKYFDSRNSNGENLVTNIFNAVGGQGVLTRSGIFDSRLSEYEKLKADVVQIETELISATDEGTRKSLEKALSNKKSTIQEIEAYMVEEASTMQNYIESMSSMYGQDEQTDAYIDRMLDYVDKWNILSGADGARESAFERLTEITFSDTVSDLKELGKQGKVTANDLQDSKYKDFIDNLIEIGFISDSTVPSLEDVALAFNEITEAVEEANNAVSSDPIEQAFQNWENAQNKTQSGVKFDTLLEALDLAYDTVADKTSDVYEKIGNADYKAAIDLLIPVDAEIDETDLADVKKYINETLKKYIKVDDDGEYSGLNVGKFLSDSVTAGIMTQDGDNYSVNSDVTLEKWAKKLGLSASTIKAILGELEEYGAEFQFFEFDEDFEFGCCEFFMSTSM